MKIEKILLYGVLGFIAYKFLFRKASPNTNTGVTAVTPDVVDGGDTPPPTGLASPAKMASSPNDYKCYFRYAGSSALRTMNGQPVNCGKPGDPYSSVGVEGHFAKNGFAPTTYFAVLELGSKTAIYEGYSEPNGNVAPGGGLKVNVGDQLLLSVTGGQFSALDNQLVTVLQVGTDACTASGAPELMNSGIVIDVPIILQGADDAQYPAQDAIGYFTKI